MKLKFKLITLLALAGIGFASSAATAATTVYNSDDLILGFRQTGGSFVYLVNLGQASAYRDYASGAPTTSFAISGLGNIAQDLNDTFGATWFNDPTLNWGVVGTPGATAIGSDLASYLYATKPQTTYGTTGTGFNQANNATQANPRGKIVNLGATFNGQTSTTNSNVGLVQAAATTNGWDSQTSAGNDFAYFGNIEGTFASGAASSALDLFRMATSPVGQPGSYEGSFFFTNAGATTGTLNFGSVGAAVPEPSRALLLGLGGVSLIFRRRRTVAPA